MMGHSITLNSHPKRIVSVVPSQTELLFDLGLDDAVVGITKFCVHPHSWFQQKPKIGGTKKLNIPAIKALQPDIVIANKEENTLEDIRALQAFVPVWLSDIVTINDAYTMILEVSKLTDTYSKGQEIVAALEQDFDSISGMLAHKRIAYFIWKNPWMVAANQTFIHAILQHLGAINVFENLNRYPEVSEEQIQAASPEVVLLSSEPFPFKAQHAEELQNFLPSAKIVLVDGEVFSWYGSRLLHLKTYMQEKLAGLIG